MFGIENALLFPTIFPFSQDTGYKTTVYSAYFDTQSIKLLEMTLLRNNYTRCNWFGRLTILLVIAWLLIIVISLHHIFRIHSVSLETRFHSEEIIGRVQKITDDFQLLRKQNDFLRSLILRIGYKSFKRENSKTDNFFKNTINLLTQKCDLNGSSYGPSLLYEEIRRKIKNDVQEVWYFINEEFNRMKDLSQKFDLNDHVISALERFNEYKTSLIVDINKLSDVDGYMDWRKKEAFDLATLVQERFRYLQNPPDCSSARKLICNINKGCGFGCQIHHLVYCFVVAYGTERTLILKSKGWRYQKEGWESIFKPLSETCLSVSGEIHMNWPADQSKQVVELPIVDNVYPKPIFQPPSIPADLAERLQKIHGYPLVWWVGQVLKYLMRPNEDTRILLENEKEKMKFIKPIVGVHIRRTDKVGTEAAFHNLDEYMVKVQQYYDSLEEKPEKRRIFLASDDPKVIMTAKQRYGEYEIIADADIARTASVSRRYSKVSLKGIVIDIHFLSLCDHLVCTFSSQVCRVAYELMQTYQPDAHDRFDSLDDIYYYGGQNPHPQIAIINHIPKNKEEIELRVNDEIEVYGNHWNGQSKGRNLRTGVTGLFPSFKIRNTIKAVKFPTYKNVLTDNNSVQ